MYDFTTLPLLVLFCASDPGFLGFCTLLHMLRWIRGQSIQVLGTMPLWKKEFLPGSGQGRGRCHPLVAVEAESNMENSILWRHPTEEDVGGAWFISVGAQRAWIVVANLGQLKWPLLPENLSSSYKFNFSLQWQTVKNKNNTTKEGRKLKCPCLHAFLKCHAPNSHPCYHPSLSAINCLMKKKAQNKTSAKSREAIFFLNAQKITQWLLCCVLKNLQCDL